MMIHQRKIERKDITLVTDLITFENVFITIWDFDGGG